MKELRKTIYFISFPLSFIEFIFPIYASSLGANIIEVGYTYSVFSLVNIVIQPMVGSLIDKRGRKTGVITGIIFYTIVNLIFILGSSFKYLLIGRTLQSIAGSFLGVSVDTFISDFSNENNRGKNFGLMEESIIKGKMLGSIIGFTILFSNYINYPFQSIFIIFLITSLISLYYGIKTVPETIYMKKEYKEGRIKERKELRIFLVIICMITFMISLTAPIYLLYLQNNITKNLSLISFLFIPEAIISIFLPSKFGLLSDKYGREKMILIGLFIISIFQIFLPLNNSYYGFMIIYTIISLGGMLYSPSLSSVIMDFIGAEKRGRVYGQYSLAKGIGASLGPMVGSYIYKILGDDSVFYIKGVLLLIMTIILFAIYINILNINKLEKTPKINPGGK